MYKNCKRKKAQTFFICLGLPPFLSHKCTPNYSGSCPSAKLSECFRGNHTLPPRLGPGWSRAHQSYPLFPVTVREDRPKPGGLSQRLAQKGTWSPIWVNEMQGAELLRTQILDEALLRPGLPLDLHLGVSKPCRLSQFALGLCYMHLKASYIPIMFNVFPGDENGI